MMRQTLVSASMVFLFGTLSLGCESGGVGDPCIPNDEFYEGNQGATEDGAQIEDRSFQCETRVCMVKHFRGRVSCPFGNIEGRGGRPVAGYSGEDADYCVVPGTTTRVTVPVKPQCAPRKDHVYCSCRCAGEEANAKYCECPDGYTCEEATRVLDPTLVAPGDKYCIKEEDIQKGVRDGYTCPAAQGCDEVAGRCGFTKNVYEF